MQYYKVQVFVVDKVSVYHVVNTGTKISHSNWLTYERAMQVMRDLNRHERRIAREKHGIVAVRSEAL